MADTITSSSLLKNVSRYEDVKEAAKKTKEEMGKQEFLTLFTAQLQNQNPLEPVKNEAFVAQLALALSVAGQCLVLYAMGKDARGIAPIATAALVLQTANGAVQAQTAPPIVEIPATDQAEIGAFGFKRVQCGADLGFE